MEAFEKNIEDEPIPMMIHLTAAIVASFVGLPGGGPDPTGMVLIQDSSGY